MPVSTITAAAARGRSRDGAAYAANVSAIAAQLASLPTTKPQPARKPQNALNRLRPYTYVPPDSGYNDASSADDVALQYATHAATRRPISSALPATSAAGPSAEKMPAPIIAPKPITTASPTPSLRAKRLRGCAAACAIRAE